MSTTTGPAVASPLAAPRPRSPRRPAVLSIAPLLARRTDARSAVLLLPVVAFAATTTLLIAASVALGVLLVRLGCAASRPVLDRALQGAPR